MHEGVDAKRRGKEMVIYETENQSSLQGVIKQGKCSKVTAALAASTLVMANENDFIADEPDKRRPKEKRALQPRVLAEVSFFNLEAK